MVAVDSETTNTVDPNKVLHLVKSLTRKPRTKKEEARQPIELRKNYTRAEAAKVVPCAPITLIRAYYAGHLSAYRVGRNILHSGQHLIDWLEAGGKTGHGGKEDDQ